MVRLSTRSLCDGSARGTRRVRLVVGGLRLWLLGLLARKHGCIQQEDQSASIVAANFYYFLAVDLEAYSLPQR